MKRITVVVAIAAAALLLGSCSTVSYFSDSDAQHDFAVDRTFAWYDLPQRPGPGPSALPPNGLVTKRVRRAVAAELGRRGLESAAAADADVLVTANIAFDRERHVYFGGWGRPYIGAWWGPWGLGYAHTFVVTRGTLVVDILDGKNRSLVWRGVADGAFDTPDPTQAEVTAVIQRMMADFPVS